MEYQLRDYLIRPGEMEDWIKEQRSKVYPLRKKLGFRVEGAWAIEEANHFVLDTHLGRSTRKFSRSR